MMAFLLKLQRMEVAHEDEHTRSVVSSFSQTVCVSTTSAFC